MDERRGKGTRVESEKSAEGKSNKRIFGCARRRWGGWMSRGTSSERERARGTWRMGGGASVGASTWLGGGADEQAKRQSK